MKGISSCNCLVVARTKDPVDQSTQYSAIVSPYLRFSVVPYPVGVLLLSNFMKWLFLYHSNMSHQNCRFRWLMNTLFIRYATDNSHDDIIIENSDRLWNVYIISSHTAETTMTSNNDIIVISHAALKSFCLQQYKLAASPAGRTKRYLCATLFVHPNYSFQRNPWPSTHFYKRVQIHIITRFLPASPITVLAPPLSYLTFSRWQPAMSPGIFIVQHVLETSVGDATFWWLRCLLLPRLHSD